MWFPYKWRVTMTTKVQIVMRLGILRDRDPIMWFFRTLLPEMPINQQSRYHRRIKQMRNNWFLQKDSLPWFILVSNKWINIIFWSISLWYGKSANQRLFVFVDACIWWLRSCLSCHYMSSITLPFAYFMASDGLWTKYTVSMLCANGS